MYIIRCQESVYFWGQGLVPRVGHRVGRMLLGCHWCCIFCLGSGHVFTLLKFLNLYVCDLTTFFYVCHTSIKYKSVWQRLKRYENNIILKLQLLFWSSGNRVISFFFTFIFFAKFSLLLFTHVYANL